MIGKILGAVAGQRAASHISGVSGPAGAVLGAGTVAVARRLGPLGLIAALIGGYAYKRHREKQNHPVKPAAARKSKK